MRKNLRCVIGTFIVLAASFGTADAQSSRPRPDRLSAAANDGRIDNAACLNAIPASAMSPAIVYLTVDPPLNSAALRFLPVARDLAERVAERMRLEFPSNSSVQQLGLAEPRVTWQGATGSLRVRAYRDGRLAWNDSLSDSVDWAGLRVLSSALRAVRDSSDRAAWPPGIVRDSVDFAFMLTTSTVDRNGRVTVAKAGDHVPVFRVMQPWIEYVKLRNGGAPRYPAAAMAAGSTAVLKFSASVDTTGRVDMSTVRLIAHEDQPGQAGLLLRHHDDFVKSVETHYARARFSPARIGGCAVKHGFMQKFEFRIDP